MNRKRLISLLIPYVYSLFFTAAVTAFIWMTVNYASFSFTTAVVGIFAAFYALVAVASLINVGKGNRFLSGSSADVLSVRAQKIIRAAGILLALPALLFCAAFALTVLTFDGMDEHSVQRACDMSTLECSIFGKSQIWNYCNWLGRPAPALTSAQDCCQPIAAAPEPAKGDIDYGPYMADLQRRIKRAWFPPRANECQQVVVTFKVHRDGTVSNIALTGASGDQMEDQSALKAIENAAPFKPLPQGSPDMVDIQFTFDYNVWSAYGHGTKYDTVHTTTGDAFASSGTDAFSTAGTAF